MVFKCTEDYLSAWEASKRNQLVKRTGTPYTLFVTNVPLLKTPAQGIQKINEMISNYAKKLGMKGWNIWHHRTLCSLLENAPKTRAYFSGYIMPGRISFSVPPNMD